MIPKPPTALEVAQFLDKELIGPDMQIKKPMSVSNWQPGAICFAKDVPIEKLRGLHGALVLTTEQLIDYEISHIVCERPRLEFARVIRHYFMDIGIPSISPSAVVHSCVTMGMGCTVKSGAVIGEDGFGFEKDESGVPIRIPHIGGVTLGFEVEVGANTVIARGTMDNTVIHDYVKLDDLVFVAHNVEIGARSQVIAKAEISGSVRVGEDVWIGPGACIRDNITIGHDAVIGMGAVVVSDVAPHSTVVGNPARVLR